jgi:type IV secretory pathway TraG/TraD family ATPase VirD4
MEVTMASDLTELNQRRQKSLSGLQRGDIPKKTIKIVTSLKDALIHALKLGAAAVVLVYLVGFLLPESMTPRMGMGNLAFLLGMIVFYLVFFYPYLSLILNAVYQRRLPDFQLLQTFSFWHIALINLALITPITLSLGPTKSAFGNLIALPILLSLGIAFFLSKLSHSESHRTKKNRNDIVYPNKSLTGVWVGESTGHLAALSHQANIAPDQQVALFGDDLSQNVLILGAIGSGKTTRAVNPLLAQLLEQQCGGLIFDIKGDFNRTVSHFAELTTRNYQTLGVGKTCFNLLAGLSPEMSASFLKSIFVLNGIGTSDSFWVETASELCRNALGVLSFLPEHYSLSGLYKYVFDPEWHAEQSEQIENLRETLSEAQQQQLDAYYRYERYVLPTFDDKVIRSVKATLAQILSPFQHPDLIETFCTATPSAGNLEEVLTGAVFLVDVPLSRWGLGAKVIYTLIKLRFFNIMQQRAIRPEWNQSNVVFFICDEYQEIVSANKDGLSDLNFWDKSRSSKTVGVISAQSVSSFYAAIGNRDITHALLQNFRQKLCFRTEDQNTIELFNRLMGTVEVTKVTSSQTFSEASTSQGTSISAADKLLLDGQFFRSLSAESMLAVLSLNGMGFDDVLKVKPCFIPQ